MSFDSESFLDKPPVILVVGMAGSGKTTLVQRLKSHLHALRDTFTLPQASLRKGDRKSDSEQSQASKEVIEDVVAKRVPFVVNLDPAVQSTPYSPNIDIRDSVDYKKLMQQHGWGPNGAILSCLNVFATKIDDLNKILLGKVSWTSFYIFDTPGQIEIFTWSASGEIISKYMSTIYPTVILYVVDAERCTNPMTFTASMIYACSIMYRLGLPIIVVFNKADLVPKEQSPVLWMRDHDLLSEEFRALLDSAPDSASYSEVFYDGVSTVLEEFYSLIESCSVSSHTGSGFDELVHSIERASIQFCAEYEERAKETAEEKKRIEQLRIKRETERLRVDMNAYLCEKDEDKLDDVD